MTHASLFSGIGGFDLAAQWAGFENLFNCEIDPFCRTVLKYYFPHAAQYEDIRTTDFTLWRGKVDILTGGFPCQPFSLAGKRKGTEDDRHLWPEMLRAIREIRPRWVVGENVLGIINWSKGMVFDQVCADLEAAGYEVQPYLLPAAGVGAPHQRYRVWFVAHRYDRWIENKRGRIDGANESGDVAHSDNDRQGRGADQQVSIAGSCGASNAGTGGEDEYAADTNCLGLQARMSSGFGPYHSQDRSGIYDRASRLGDNGSIADTNRERCAIQIPGASANPISKRLEGKIHRRKQKGEGNSCGVWGDTSGCNIPDWQNFPTQSPVCVRNDGLSAWVDDEALLAGRRPRQPYISIAKLRMESIKAYGNAIVPQVVYQIFETIREYKISRVAELKQERK